jgi:hypothetical protein
MQKGCKDYKTKVEEYNGEKEFVLSGFDCSAAEKNKLAKEWNDFLQKEQLPIEKLWITASYAHKIFDAVCCQKSIKYLFIKSGSSIDNISNITKLSNLEYFHLNGGNRLTNIEVISELSNLKTLEICKLYAINDFSFLLKMKHLTELSIEGDYCSAMKKVTIKSLDFLEKMPQLESLDLCMLTVEDHSYAPIMKLPNLKHLTLPNNKDIKKDIVMWQNFIDKIDEKSAPIR